MTGWIKMYRQIQENWTWDSNEPYDKRSAWIYLLLNANYDSSSKSANGEIIKLERGQIFVSVRTLAAKWKWSESKTYSFIKQLENERMIKTIKKKSGTLLTIENYEFFQSEGNAEQTLTEQQANSEQTASKQQANADETPTEHNKRNKNKEEINNNIYNTAKEHEREAEELFNTLWKLYPRKLGKGQVKMKQKLRLRKIGYDKLATAIDNYKRHIEDKGTSEDYIMYGSTFFNSGYVDFLEDENPQNETITITDDTEAEPQEKQEEYKGYEVDENGIPIFTDEMWENMAKGK